MPVLTADYDFWLAIEDIELFNRTCQSFDLRPTRTPEEARRAGRYLLEHDERVDVLVGRSVPTAGGDTIVEFQGLWEHRRIIDLRDDISVSVPTIADLILTKQIAARPKDLEDIRLLKALRGKDER